MALLVLVYSYLKFFSAMSCLTLQKYTPALCIRNILYFLLMPAIGTLYFLFFNLYSPPIPAILMKAALIPASSASIADRFAVFSSTLARFRLHSFRIRCCSWVKFFRMSSSSSARIDTILPRAVSGPIPIRRSLNSSHFIPAGSSRDKRIPYCD